MKYLVAALSTLCIAFAESHACIGGDPSSNPCVIEVTDVVAGVENDPVFDVGSVNIRYSYNGNGYWFWTTSTHKSMVLSMALAAQTAGKRLSVRWVAQNNGTNQIDKKIVYVSIQP